MSDHQLPRHDIGANNPPPDPYLARLEENNADLTNRQVALEMEAAALPKVVETEDHLAAINGWVVKARALAREAEQAREVEKRPILTMTRTLDGFFAAIRDGLKKRADGIEARNAPYLRAKQQRAEAEARARAEAARQAQAERERIAREAREAEEAAARRADEEAARLREAAAEQPALDEKAEEWGLEPLSAGADDAEAASRRAEADRQDAAKARADADADVASAAAETERAEKAAAGGHKLSKTAVGGGSASVKTVYDARIDNQQELLASLGALGPYLANFAVDDALSRAAKAEPRPIIPGVSYVAREKVSTRATRN